MGKGHRLSHSLLPDNKASTVPQCQCLLPLALPRPAARQQPFQLSGMGTQQELWGGVWQQDPPLLMTGAERQGLPRPRAEADPELRGSRLGTW